MTAPDLQLSCYLVERIFKLVWKEKNREEMWETKVQPMMSLKDCGQKTKDVLLQDFFQE